jgi:hypothetical protein
LDLKKYIKQIIKMITEDSLATAQIAQLFGSELLKVQRNATTDSGMQPNIVNLNPKQFLVGQTQMTNQRKVEEQRLIQMLQAEAEASCPLPDQSITPIASLPPQTAPNSESKAAAIPQSYVQVATKAVGVTVDVWERINTNLERIANRLEKVDIGVKKKRIKRIKHEANS